ncbi:MAG TPA: hypothetical protein VFQ53_34020 [Kofleriaceae bacterium]|nr:hypothetical protein [Kofleriaceae bacterium]
MSMRRLSLVLAGATAAVLIAMVAVSIATGATQEAHEHFHPYPEYATALIARPGGLRALMGLDVAFLCLYTGFFAAFATYLRQRGQPFTYLALGAMVATALLDIVEDHHILSLLAMAESGRPIAESTIAFQETLSSTKFSVSYLALFLFGLAIPRTSKLGWALALFLTAGTLASATLGYAAPPAWRESLDSGRWIGFLAGFAIAGAWLVREPESSTT